MKAIINGKIILKDKIVEDQAVIFSDIIENIVSTKDLPKNIETIDAKGGYVTAGLIDLHIHGYNGKDFSVGSKEDIEDIAKCLLANGVTAFLPTTMTVDLKTISCALEKMRELKEESKTWSGAQILGCHLEGPFISKSKKGAHNSHHILKPDASFVKKYSDIIKIVTVAPEEDAPEFNEIKEVAQNTDVIVSMGHTNADYETAINAVEKGVKHTTHLFNAMSPLSHREPGVVAAALNSDVSCELIVDTYHVSPVLYDMVWKLKGSKLCFITDCISAGGLKDGEYKLGNQKVIYKNNLCYLEDGTIAGSVLKLNEGIKNVYKNSNIPLYQCVNCATLNPATVIGMNDRKGSIEPNKDADMVIFDKDFNVKKTFLMGEIKYES